MIFHAEMYTIKACITDNIEEGSTGRSICTVTESHAYLQSLPGEGTETGQAENMRSTGFAFMDKG
jgi:hypothetical protein